LTPGQFSSISAFHFVSMFSSESCESTYAPTVSISQQNSAEDGIGRAYTKAEHDRMCVVVTQTPQSIKLLLPGRVPQTEFNMGIVEEDVVNVIFEDGRLIDGGKVPARKHIEKRCLAACAVPTITFSRVCQLGAIWVLDFFDCGSLERRMRLTGVPAFATPSSSYRKAAWLSLVRPRVVVSQ